MEQENCAAARGVLLDSEQLSSVSVSVMVGGKINGMERLVCPLCSGMKWENEEGVVMEGFGIIISQFSEPLSVWDLAGEKNDTMELE